MMSRTIQSTRLSLAIKNTLKKHGFHYVEELENAPEVYLAKGNSVSVAEVITIAKHSVVPVVTDAMTLLKNSFSAKQKLLRLKTGCKALDKALGDGLPQGKVIEIYGEAGSGKSQLCMQLCCNVQISSDHGGLEGEALYIDTEGSFRSERVAAIGMAVPEVDHDEFLNKIYVVYCSTPERLEACLLYKVEEFLETNPNVKLVVIDSISYQLRYGCDQDYRQRKCLLNKISLTLKRLACTYNVCVIIANQMTSDIERDENIAALGVEWRHTAKFRILLRKYRDFREAVVERSLLKKPSEAFYAIMPEGIRDVPSKDKPTAEISEEKTETA